jgi:hypothetical protein
MAYTGKLDLAGSFRSSQSSLSIIEKYVATIESLTSSSLEGSHCERREEAKDEIIKKNKPTDIYIMKIIGSEKSKMQRYRNRMHVYLLWVLVLSQQYSSVALQ